MISDLNERKLLLPSFLRYVFFLSSSSSSLRPFELLSCFRRVVVRTYFLHIVFLKLLFVNCVKVDGRHTIVLLWRNAPVPIFRVLLIFFFQANKKEIIFIIKTENKQEREEENCTRIPPPIIHRTQFKPIRFISLILVHFCTAYHVHRITFAQSYSRARHQLNIIVLPCFAQVALAPLQNWTYFVCRTHIRFSCLIHRPTCSLVHSHPDYISVSDSHILQNRVNTHTLLWGCWARARGDILVMYGAVVLPTLFMICNFQAILLDITARSGTMITNIFTTFFSVFFYASNVLRFTPQVCGNLILTLSHRRRRLSRCSNQLSGLWFLPCKQTQKKNVIICKPFSRFSVTYISVNVIWLTVHPEQFIKAPSEKIFFFFTYNREIQITIGTTVLESATSGELCRQKQRWWRELFINLTRTKYTQHSNEKPSSIPFLETYFLIMELLLVLAKSFFSFHMIQCSHRSRSFFCRFSHLFLFAFLGQE